MISITRSADTYILSLLRSAVIRKCRKLFLAAILTFSTSSCALDKLETFPEELLGVWKNEAGSEKLSGCNTRTIAVSNQLITVFRDCVDEGRQAIRLRIKDVLVDHSFFSKNIEKYHVLTNGSNVVFDLLSEPGKASIYLQFWVTNDYGPVRQLGVFNWSSN